MSHYMHSNPFSPSTIELSMNDILELIGCQLNTLSTGHFHYSKNLLNLINKVSWILTNLWPQKIQSITFVRFQAFNFSFFNVAFGDGLHFFKVRFILGFRWSTFLSFSFGDLSFCSKYIEIPQLTHVLCTVNSREIILIR